MPAADNPAYLSFTFADWAVEVTMTTRRAGDLRPATTGWPARRQAVLPGPEWAAVRQVHGAVVASIHDRGGAADALVTASVDRPAMFAADCALLGLASREGVVAAVHAGWHGLCAGVIEETAAAMGALGASSIQAVRGPCIGPECYEFGLEDLEVVARRYGSSVRGETAGGRPALDLAAGVRAACARAGIELVEEIDSCTACAVASDGEAMWFSHRARKDEGRHALVVSEPR